MGTTGYSGPRTACEACNAVPFSGDSCEADFYMLLAWEHERRELLEVHHLMVLAYHLQHPHLYSPEGLAYARRLLADFLVGLTPTAARARARGRLGAEVRGASSE
jgi:hypothetical protein